MKRGGEFAQISKWQKKNKLDPAELGLQIFFKRQRIIFC